MEHPTQQKSRRWVKGYDVPSVENDPMDAKLRLISRRPGCTHLYLLLRSDSLLLSMVAVLYGLAVLRVKRYGSFLALVAPPLERSGAPGPAPVLYFSRSLESSCWLEELIGYLAYVSL